MTIQELNRGQRFEVAGTGRKGKLIDKSQGAATIQYDGDSSLLTVSLSTPVKTEERP